MRALENRLKATLIRVSAIILLNKRRVLFIKAFLWQLLLFYWYKVRADSIIVNWKDIRPVGVSLNCMVGIAWLLEKQGIAFKFKRPSSAMWRHFENNVLFNATNRPKQKCRPSRQVILGDDLMEQVAIKFASSEYGHKVFTRLSIKEDLQKSANEWFEAHIKGDWVAVHYRGTDIRGSKRERFFKGGSRIDLERSRINIKPYVAYLEEVLDSQCTIFACSDQAQFIDEMKAVFSGRMFARDIKRSYDEEPLHSVCRIPKHDSFDQERDALIDLLVLAKSELIYTTGSGFINVVRYFNPEVKIASLDGRTMRGWKNNLPIPKLDLLEKLSLPE